MAWLVCGVNARATSPLRNNRTGGTYPRRLPARPQQHNDERGMAPSLWIAPDNRHRAMRRGGDGGVGGRPSSAQPRSQWSRAGLAAGDVQCMTRRAPGQDSAEQGMARQLGRWAAAWPRPVVAGVGGQRGGRQPWRVMPEPRAWQAGQWTRCARERGRHGRALAMPAACQANGDRARCRFQ